MQQDLKLSLTYLFNDEGGYAKRAEEPGGYVNRGVTMQTFIAWRHLMHMPVPTPADLQNMSEAEASQIYEAQYAMPISFASLPPGVDYVVLNAAVMDGVTGAGKFLQRALNKHGNNLVADGHIGISTLAAARAINDHKMLIAAVLAQQLTFKAGRPSWQKYKRGWTARLNRVKLRAERML